MNNGDIIDGRSCTSTRSIENVYGQVSQTTKPTCQSSLYTICTSCFLQMNMGWLINLVSLKFCEILVGVNFEG